MFNSHLCVADVPQALQVLNWSFCIDKMTNTYRLAVIQK